jgi:hypothetical protein
MHKNEEKSFVKVTKSIKIHSLCSLICFRLEGEEEEKIYLKLFSILFPGFLKLNSKKKEKKWSS